jgi:hypothetical protein
VQVPSDPAQARPKKVSAEAPPAAATGPGLRRGT